MEEKKVNVPSKKIIIPCHGLQKSSHVCNPQTGLWIEKCSVAYQKLVENYINNVKGDLIPPDLPKPIPVVLT